MVLVEHVLYGPAPIRVGTDGTVVEARRLRLGKTVRTFDGLVAGGEAPRGEAGCEQAVHGCFACMERLGHGAEIDFQTGSL